MLSIQLYLWKACDITDLPLLPVRRPTRREIWGDAGKSTQTAGVAFTAPAPTRAPVCTGGPSLGPHVQPDLSMAPGGLEGSGL